MTDPDAAFANSQADEFPGYEYGDGLTAAGPRTVTGVKPMKYGPVAVAVSFSGFHVVVKVHVDSVGVYGPRDFDPLDFHPGALTHSTSIEYKTLGVEVASVDLVVKIVPSARRVHVTVTPHGLASLIPTISKNFPYSTFVLPRLSGPVQPRKLDPPTIQGWLDKSVWKKVTGGGPGPRQDAKTQSDTKSSLTMLGAQDTMAGNQAYIAGAMPEGSLGAIGVAGEVAFVYGNGTGWGLYFTGLDIGCYGSMSASIGAIIGLEGSLELALYWPTKDKTALENFSGIEWFVSVGGYIGIGVGLKIGFDPPIRPVGITESLGTGEEVSVALGVESTATHSFVKH